jgi:hypothetical protein
MIEVTEFADLDAVEEVPSVYALDQNYPNPFNPSTTIRYDLPETSHVRLIVYDVLGRSVMHLVDAEKEAGRYEITFDGRDLASGTYFYELRAGDFTRVHKMTLMK